MSRPEHALDLDRLYHTHARAVFGLALQITSDPVLAEDAVQETFLAAHRGRAGYRGESAPSTWLYRIAVRESCRLRAAARRTAAQHTRANDAALQSRDWSGETLTPGPAATAVAQEDLQRLLRVLDLLPDEQRLALVLLQARDIPGEAIAEMLGVPLGTVYTRAFAARKQLCRLLSDNESPSMPPRAHGSPTPACVAGFSPRGSSARSRE